MTRSETRWRRIARRILARVHPVLEDCLAAAPARVVLAAVDSEEDSAAGPEVLAEVRVVEEAVVVLAEVDAATFAASTRRSHMEQCSG